MTTILKSLGLISLFALCVLTPRARAVLITAAEVGPDVVFTAAPGVLDTTALGIGAAAFLPDVFPGITGGIFPDGDTLIIGDVSSLVHCFSSTLAGDPPFSGTSSWGDGSLASSVGSSFAGDAILIAPSFELGGFVGDLICLPPLVGTISTILGSSMTFSGKSFGDLGITPGASSTWSWGTGMASETITLTVVPEPSTYFAGAFALGVIGWTLLRKRKTMLTNRSGLAS